MKATLHEIYWSVVRHPTPAMLEVTTQAKALGIKLDGNWSELTRHACIDGADALGIPVSAIDIERDSHRAAIADAMVHQVRDAIDSAPGCIDSSASSYLQKAP